MLYNVDINVIFTQNAITQISEVIANDAQINQLPNIDATFSQPVHIAVFCICGREDCIQHVDTVQVD